MTNAGGVTVENIAIIGMAGRFPGAENISEFWRNVERGVESVQFFTNEELLALGADPEEIRKPSYVKAHSSLTGAELFDAEFFGFTPREAELTDPQQRVFLECAWHAFEDAGYDPHTYSGRISVFAGQTVSSYFYNNICSHPDWTLLFDGLKVTIGNHPASLATRLAHKLNLRGPAVNLQTACSTSLVAVHLACQSLLTYESDIALAGGVSINFPLWHGYQYEEGGILSPDGHCRTFDAKASGTVGGSGIGLVVLKRLSEAIDDDDQIHAVIRGTAINNDGSDKLGYTAPSVAGQADVVAAAQAAAGVPANAITYVETHGTATPMGDPIEIAALNRVFPASTHNRKTCALGAVKASVGHLDAAAGITGLIKTAMALRHKRIPPCVHFNQPNPQLRLEQSPFYVPREAEDWRISNGTRLAGVSSFGIGGTNAHVILEEAPSRPTASLDTQGESQLLVLSARSDATLHSITQNLITHLDRDKDANLANIASTLQKGRHEFAHRSAVVCDDRENAIKALQRASQSKPAKAEAEPAVYFLFPGQGAQYEGMAAGLYATERVFRESLDRSAEIAKQIVHFDFRQHLWSKNGDIATEAHTLDDTLVTQLVMFSVDYALAQLWIDLGVKPRAMVGHSLGEYVAASIAGVLSHEDAISLVCRRAALMQNLPRGSMLSVALAERELKNIMPANIDLAAVNTPSQCVVAGPSEAITEFQAQLAQENIHSQVLRTSHAFHSAMMEPACESLVRHIATLNLKSPVIPYISNVTGQPITNEEATSPAYWGRHLRETVRFAQGCSFLGREQSGVFLEVGPGRTLTGLARQILGRSTGSQAVASLGSGNDAATEREALLKSIGTLWKLGKKIRWSSLWKGKNRQCVSLPGYAFERQRYFIEPARRNAASRTQLPQAERGTDISQFFFVPVWKQSTTTNSGAEIQTKSPWVVFCDQEQFGSRFAAWLENNGCSVIRVAARVSQTKGAHRAASHLPDDYSSIFRDLQEADIKPAVIVLPLLDPDTVDPMAIVALAQALQERNWPDAVHLQVIVNGLYRVTGEEVLDPSEALILGPARVISLEMPDVTCAISDIGTHEPGSPAESRLFRKLQGDISGRSRDLFVAYRNGQRWTCTFERVVLGETTSRRLRQRGAYIITGGTNGIGLEIAGFLARSMQARLALISRSPVPAESLWADWLAKHSSHNKISKLISRIEEMRAAGAEVLIISADIADPQQVNAAIEAVAEKFGQIHGLIHAAGVAGGGILARQTRESMEACLRSKTSGTLLLERALRGQPLDFIVLFSSQVGIQGCAGRADYTAANAFLDCYAHSRCEEAPAHVLAINWDTWAEAGMAAEEAERLHVKVTDQALTNIEGVEAFRRAIETDFPQIVVSTSDFTIRLQEPSNQVVIESAGASGEAKPGLSRHPRPQLASTFTVPQTQTERTIVELWEDILGIAGIGADDNFFELGGDSVVSIQLIAKLRKKGITVSPKQVFEHSTPRALATLIDQGCGSIEAEQGVVTGTVPLTPIQHWFCVQKLTSSHQFNQDTLVAINAPLDHGILDQAFQAVLKQHDTLRLRLEQTSTGWRQWTAEYEYLPLQKYDFSALLEQKQSAAIEEKASEIQQSLDLKQGPISRLAIFDLGSGKPARMLMVVHHLAIDGVSWNILLEDLETAYGQLKRGEQINLPPKTTSFQYWAKKLETQAHLKSLEKESAYWLAEKRRSVEALPRDFATGVNTQATLRSISVSLTELKTRELLQKATALGVHMNELLITALGCGLEQWTGKPNMLLDVEGLGREPLFDDVDLSRTVGWFTAIYPLFINWKADDKLHQRLSTVKAQIRAVPGRGFGYGLLRYMTGNSHIEADLRALPQAEVSFLYSGQSNQELAQDSLFGVAAESGGTARDPQQSRAYLIDIYVRIFEGQLTMSLSYSSSIHKESTIQRLSDSFTTTLLAFLHLADEAEHSGAAIDEAEFGWDEFELNKIRKAIEESITSTEHGTQI